MKGKMVLVIGGARSGKSSFAQELASRHGDSVCFLATAEPGDCEMRRRIEKHRENRPEGWMTVEMKPGAGEVNMPEGVQVALLDCFTVYLSNLMAANGLDGASEDEGSTDESEVEEMTGGLEREALETIEGIRRSVPLLVIVSNEVGAGLVPPYRLGRIFRDLAGRLNQELAVRADEVFAVIAGLPIRLKT